MQIYEALCESSYAGYEVLPDRAILSKEIPAPTGYLDVSDWNGIMQNQHEPPVTIWAALADIVKFTSLAPLEFHSAL